MNLVWFRNDLRTLDNPALWHATQSGHTLGVFYLCPRQWRGHHMAACRVEFLLRTLNCLRQQLAALNIPLLVLFHCASISEHNLPAPSGDRYLLE